MRIALAYVHPGVVTHGFMSSVLAWRARNPSEAIVDVYSGPNLSRARNFVVDWFIDSDSDALFFVDTDMVFSPDVPWKLEALGYDITSAMCVGQNPDGTLFCPASVRDEDGSLRHVEATDLAKGDVIPVVAGGTGAILIRRAPLEELGTEPLWPFSDHDWGSPIGVTGHDVTFGLRAETAGYQSWLAVDVEVGHIKPRVLWP